MHINVLKENQSNNYYNYKQPIMKKSSSLIIYSIFTLVTIFLFSLNSCSKKDEGTKTEPIILSAEKSQYAPYEIVTISASENIFTIKSFTAKINNIEVIISANDSIASFVLPNLINGNYDLNFTLNEKKYSVPITVSSLSNILSADQYFNDIQSDITQNINDLNSQITLLEQNSANPSEYANLKNDVIKFTNLLNDFTVSYNNLSASEKLEFAKTMAANKASIDEYNNLTSALQTSTATLRTTQSVQDYETGVETSMAAFTVSVIYTVGHIPFILSGTKLAAATFNPGVILACGIVTGSFLINVSRTASLGAALVGKSLKPFEFIAQTSQTVYNSGVETVSDIQAKYRSLLNSDTNNSENGSTINTIVEKYNYFKDKYNSFINELPDIFRPSYIMTSLKNTYNSTTRSIYNQYVSITNVSNPNVTLQQLNQPDGSIKIKVTNTASTDQTFTYNLNYTNSNFTNGLTKTVNAKVIRACLFNEVDIVGNWKQNWYANVDDCSALSSSVPYEFRADKSVWMLGLTQDQSNDINGSSGYGTWNLSCNGYLSVNIGIGWGGLLNSSGNETECNISNGGSNKFVKE